MTTKSLNEQYCVLAGSVSAAYADLAVETIAAPDTALSGENVQVSWQVRNFGNSGTDLVL